MEPDARTFLHALLQAHGPSGAEDAAAAVWRARCRESAEVWGDAVGNSYAALGPAEAPSVLLLGHLDEIGLIVTDVEADGAVRVRGLGEWDDAVLLGQRVEIHGADGRLVPGGIARAPVHLLGGEAAPVRLRDLWLDVGARDGDEARALVALGDTATLVAPPTTLAGGRLTSKALDDRAGAWVCAEVVRSLAEGPPPAVRVVAVADVLEETTGDGSRIAAHTVDPVVSIVVDVTFATDIPGPPGGTGGAIRLGGGPVLSRGLGVHPGLFVRLRDTADELGLAHQVEALHGGTTTLTDLDGALDALRGSATALVSIPLRHMHMPVEICDPTDLEAVVRLLTAFCRGLRADERWER